MCGIVGFVSEKNQVSWLLEGLKRLEYRGYDSCGLALHTGAKDNPLLRARSTARVSDLTEQVQAQSDAFKGTVGIAHTRWATHGAPLVHNAHPHFSNGRIALVHNGIIENHEALRTQLQQQGYVFESQTDTEVIAHLVDSLYSGDFSGDLFLAVQQASLQLRGAYAVAVMAHDQPHRLVGARVGSPLVVGLGDREFFLASDAIALVGLTDQMIYLEEGDVVDLCLDGHMIVQKIPSIPPLAKGGGGDFQTVTRTPQVILVHSSSVELGPYRHYMQKEIFEQPGALADTLVGIEGAGDIVPELFGAGAGLVFKEIDSVLILACGTSYYAGLVAKYWLESIVRIKTEVEVASEYRYRESVPSPRTLVVTISQSGETADTLSALRHARSLGMHHTLTVCNVATSTMVRECSLAYITRAGIEIGVASTKAFTTQLAGLFLLSLTLAKVKGTIDKAAIQTHVNALRHLPVALQSVLALEPQVMAWADIFSSKEHALFLGRGMHYPIALEGALKLKETSYIHAEAYPAGELKHGPLALVTDEMPVVAVAPHDALLEKLKSNLQEVRARGGQLFVLADAGTHIVAKQGIRVIHLPEHYGVLSPILHVVPLQLLAYHTACVRGTDVDKPRNLAKSVTVE